MNARHNFLNISVEHRQIKEALLCVLDTTLLHRVVAKSLQFNYGSNNFNSFSVGSIGFEEVTLESIDLTYARVNSPQLVQRVEHEVSQYLDSIKQLNSINSGDMAYGSCGSNRQRHPSIDDYRPFFSTKLSLEFYKKNRRTWSISDDVSPWEVWSIGLNVVKAEHHEDFQRLREDVGEKLGEQVLQICQIVNEPCMYIPAIPHPSDTDTVFDTSFSDIQPYLFRLNYDSGKTAEPAGITGSLKKIIKETMRTIEFV